MTARATRLSRARGHKAEARASAFSTATVRERRVCTRFSTATVRERRVCTRWRRLSGYDILDCAVSGSRSPQVHRARVARPDLATELDIPSLPQATCHPRLDCADHPLRRTAGADDEVQGIGARISTEERPRVVLADLECDTFDQRTRADVPDPARAHHTSCVRSLPSRAWGDGHCAVLTPVPIVGSASVAVKPCSVGAQRQEVRDRSACRHVHLIESSRGWLRAIGSRAASPRDSRAGSPLPYGRGTEAVG